MYVLANSLRNLLRNKGRNLIMGAIILVMLVALSVSAVIGATTDRIVADYKSRFGSDVTISYNQEKVNKILMSGAGEVPGITPEQYLAFGKSGHLKQMTYSTSLVTSMDGLKGVDEDAQNESGLQFGSTGADVQTWSSDGASAPQVNWNAKLVGYSANMEIPSFKDGTRRLVEGEMPKGANEVVASQDLAKLNGLKVGDSITLATNMKKTTVKRPLKIVGIYYDGTKTATEGGAVPAIAMTNPKNELIASADTVLDYSREIAKTDGIVLNFIDLQATYVLKSPDDLSAFEEEVRAKGLPDVYDVTTDAASYDRIVKPMEGVSNIVGTFTLVVLVIGATILVLLTVLAIRERKYEAGVLRAMGMSRFSVARGFVYESLALTAICLALGLGAGSALARPVSEAVLESQQAQEQAAGQSGQSFTGASMTMVAVDDSSNAAAADEQDAAGADALKNVDVRLTGKAAVEVAGVALGIALVSSAVGVAYVLRLEPMRILSDRD